MSLEIKIGKKNKRNWEGDERDRHRAVWTDRDGH